MSLPNGWNSGDVWAFEQLLIKANDQQLNAALTAIASHQRCRLERELWLSYTPSLVAQRYRDNREGPKGSSQSRASFSNEPGRDSCHPHRHHGNNQREEDAAGILRSPPRFSKGDGSCQ